MCYYVMRANVACIYGMIVTKRDFRKLKNMNFGTYSFDRTIENDEMTINDATVYCQENATDLIMFEIPEDLAEDDIMGYIGVQVLWISGDHPGTTYADPTVKIDKKAARDLIKSFCAEAGIRYKSKYVGMRFSFVESN